MLWQPILDQGDELLDAYVSHVGGAEDQECNEARLEIESSGIRL